MIQSEESGGFIQTNVSILSYFGDLWEVPWQLGEIQGQSCFCLVDSTWKWAHFGLSSFFLNSRTPLLVIPD